LGHYTKLGRHFGEHRSQYLAGLECIGRLCAEYLLNRLSGVGGGGLVYVQAYQHGSQEPVVFRAGWLSRCLMF
jgi:hypothetical protein